MSWVAVVLTQNAMQRAARRFVRPGQIMWIAFAAMEKDFNGMLRARASGILTPSIAHHAEETAA